MLGLGNGGVGKWLHDDLLLARVGGDGSGVLCEQGSVRGRVAVARGAREGGFMHKGGAVAI